MAERAVRTVKTLLQSTTNMETCLLSYRSTPLKNRCSLAQLLFGRRIRTTIPITSEQRRLILPDEETLRAHETRLKGRQQINYNLRHGVTTFVLLPTGSPVFIPDRQESGVVISKPANRLYIVVTLNGEYRRNRRHINPLPMTDDQLANNDTKSSDDTTNALLDGGKGNKTAADQLLKHPLLYHQGSGAVWTAKHCTARSP